MTPDLDTEELAPRLLATYLRDHAAGAAGGLALARRMSRSNQDSPLGALLWDLAADIERDRQALEVVMARHGVRPSRWKAALARIAVAAGRFKLNGRLLRYSPLSRVLELEALSAGITAKSALWRALGSAFGSDGAGGGGWTFADLEERAHAQLALLAPFHLNAAGEAFGPVQRALAGTRGS